MSGGMGISTEYIQLALVNVHDDRRRVDEGGGRAGGHVGRVYGGGGRYGASPPAPAHLQCISTYYWQGHNVIKQKEVMTNMELMNYRYFSIIIFPEKTLNGYF